MKPLVIPFFGQCEESFCDYFCRSLLVDFLYHLPLPYSVQSECIDIFITCVRYRQKWYSIGQKKDVDLKHQLQMLKNLIYYWFSRWPRMQDNGVKRRLYLEEEVAGCNRIDC